MQIVSPAQLRGECVRHTREGRLTILAGAGISMLSPTRLPSAFQLKCIAVETICDIPKLRRYARRAICSKGFPSLVLEILFQRFYECFSRRLYPFFDILSSSRPNVAHTVLAKLHHEFEVPILTTNFDTLIEQEQKDSKPILHLHGDLTNKEQMIFRIHQVGRGLAKDVTKTAGVVIRHRVLCVLGYSGSDEDIRALVKQHQPTQIFWLLQKPNDIAMINIQRFFANFKVTVAIGDLGEFIRRWAVMLKCRICSRKSRYIRLTEHPSYLWHKLLTVRERYADASELMFDLEEYQMAAEVALLGYRKCERAEKLSWFLVQAANAYRVLGDTPEALVQAKAALIVARRENDPWSLAAALNVYGLVYLEQRETNPSCALPLFRQSGRLISTALRRPHPPEILERMNGFAARVFNNLGLTLMQLRKNDSAKHAFLKSVSLKRKGGDLIGIATTAANLARLNYRRQNYPTASKWKRRALHFIERYDRRFTRAYLLRSFGGIACEQGRIRQGLRMLNEALEIYQNLIGDGLGVQLTKEMITKFSKGKSF